MMRHVQGHHFLFSGMPRYFCLNILKLCPQVNDVVTSCWHLKVLDLLYWPTIWILFLKIRDPYLNVLKMSKSGHLAWFPEMAITNLYSQIENKFHVHFLKLPFNSFFYFRIEFAKISEKKFFLDVSAITFSSSHMKELSNDRNPYLFDFYDFNISFGHQSTIDSTMVL